LADLHAVVGGDLAQVDVGLAELELVELAAQQAQRQGGAVHGDLRQQADHVRQAADVVLVAVGQHPAAHLVGVLDHPVDLRHDDVDAQHLRLGEGQAAVDEQDLVVVLEGEHVLADLAHAAERDDLQLAVVLERRLVGLRDVLRLALARLAARRAAPAVGGRSRVLAGDGAARGAVVAGALAGAAFARAALAGLGAAAAAAAARLRLGALAAAAPSVLALLVAALLGALDVGASARPAAVVLTVVVSHVAPSALRPADPSWVAWLRRG